MARVPTMTIEECEAQLGPRGVARIDSGNRAIFRKWIAAKGFPSALAASMGLKSMNKAYADTTDRYVNACIRNAAERGPTQDMNGEDHDTGEDMQAQIHETTPIARTPVTPPMGNDPAELMRAALTAMGMGGGNVKREDVESICRDIVADAVQSAIKDLPPRRLEICIPEKTPVQIDGPQHAVFGDVLAAVAAGCNVMLVGPAGCGKTHLAESVAHSLQRRFLFTGAVGSEYKLLGFLNATGQLVRTPYREAYEHGGVFLWDEMDASSANAILSFNAGLANGHQDFPDNVIKRHSEFSAIAACNTFGHGADRQYVGRNQQDAAALDRYVVISMDYDESMERALFGDNDWTNYVQKSRRAVRSLKLRHVVSMRAIADGHKLLKAGAKRAFVESAVLWKGLGADDVAKVRGGM